MAQVQYRANLSAKDFTFVAETWGRTVVLKSFDQNFSRQVVSATDPDKDIGIPQIYYCHNVMPASGGFQSIGYTKFVNPFPTGDQNEVQIFPYPDSGGFVSYVAFAIEAINQYRAFRLDRITRVWIDLGVIAVTDTT